MRIPVKIILMLSLSLCAALVMLSGCSSTNSFDSPTAFTAVAKASRIELSWQPSSAVTGYNVYRGTSPGLLQTKTRIATELSLTSYVDYTAVPGTTYYYQVTAVNATGDSTPSQELSATIKAAPAGVTLMGGTMQGAPLVMSYTVSTLAGTSTAGATDGTGTAAAFRNPIGITTDGKNLYVADTFNNSIRKIIIATGEVTTLAGSAASGSADGIGTAARFNAPYGITTDGTHLYVSDFYNHTIRKVDISNGAVTTLAGSTTFGSSNGIGAIAGFRSPRGITTDGTNVYVADSGNRTIRKIVISTGAVTTIAGSASAASGAVDGVGTIATFNALEGLTTNGTHLYLSDTGNNNIRMVELATATVTTLAGTLVPGTADGTGIAASFNAPAGITTDGTHLYVADSKNNVFRKIVIATGEVTRVCGSGTAGFADGTAATATFSQPLGITSDGANLYVTDYSHSLIREIL
jgi:sugar lactone lactonase YvrE